MPTYFRNPRFQQHSRRGLTGVEDVATTRRAHAAPVLVGCAQRGGVRATDVVCVPCPQLRVGDAVLHQRLDVQHAIPREDVGAVVAVLLKRPAAISRQRQLRLPPAATNPPDSDRGADTTPYPYPHPHLPHLPPPPPRAVPSLSPIPHRCARSSVLKSSQNTIRSPA